MTLDDAVEYALRYDRESLRNEAKALRLLGPEVERLRGENVALKGRFDKAVTAIGLALGIKLEELEEAAEAAKEDKP